MSEAYQRVVVEMAPFPKERPRVTAKGTFMPEKYQERRKTLGWLFGPVKVRPPLRLKVQATFKMPKSWSAKKRQVMNGRYRQSKPDADNIIGAVMDSLFDEDSAVVEVHCIKRWGEANRMEIELWHIDETDE